jgi:hopene-associated glycosyltransferase HpnB
MAGSTWLAAVAASIWLYLLAFRGRFWLLGEREEQAPPPPASWPSIIAVIPARDEAETLPLALASLLDQDYPGAFSIVVVDDHSSDGTAEAARALAASRQASNRVEVLSGSTLPAGWTGKLWAVSQGIAHAQLRAPNFLLLTDADIQYGPGAVRRLASRACAGGLALTSVMVKLRCASAAEKFLIPAFVFFFRMLYPFRWVNNPRARTAAAAGGCMLIEASALAGAGGVATVRSALIDDCALGALLKWRGPIWLGLSDGIISLRPYCTLADVGAMVTRSAYAQLGYSPLRLAGCILGMFLVFLAPPLLAVFAGGAGAVLGALAWLAMAAAFAPMSAFYRRSFFWGLALPAIAAAYLIFTIRSAIEHKLGRGGMWKGRAQAIPEA